MHQRGIYNHYYHLKNNVVGEITKRYFLQISQSKDLREVPSVLPKANSLVWTSGWLVCEATIANVCD